MKPNWCKIFSNQGDSINSIRGSPHATRYPIQALETYVPSHPYGMPVL